MTRNIDQDLMDYINEIMRGNRGLYLAHAKRPVMMNQPSRTRWIGLACAGAILLLLAPVAPGLLQGNLGGLAAVLMGLVEFSAVAIFVRGVLAKSSDSVRISSDDATRITVYLFRIGATRALDTFLEAGRYIHYDCVSILLMCAEAEVLGDAARARQRSEPRWKQAGARGTYRWR